MIILHIPWFHCMHEVTPSVVQIAVRMEIIVCKMNFQVCFFMMVNF